MFLAGQDDRAWALLKEIEERGITGYINPLIVDKILYDYLRLITRLGARIAEPGEIIQFY